MNDYWIKMNKKKMKMFYNIKIFLLKTFHSNLIIQVFQINMEMKISCFSFQNLHFTEKRIYKSNFWLSIFQRKWRHFQNYYWPVRFQWKLTGLMMMNDDWMFKICISPNKNGFTGQIFGFQFFKENGSTFKIVVDL